MPASRRPVVAINTLSVSDANEGIRTMLQNLVPALAEAAPDLELLLVCSPVNRHLFDEQAAGPILEVPMRSSSPLRRIWHDQWTVPGLVRGRADVLVVPSSVGLLRAAVPNVVIVPAHLVLPSCQAVAGAEQLDVLHRAYFGPVLRRSLRRTARVVAISQFLAEGLVTELGVDGRKVRSMPLGVDGPAWDPTSTPREPLCLFIGTLYPYKDAVVAVDAFAAACARLPPEARLVIVGRDPTGREIAALEGRAAALGAGHRIDVVGSVTGQVLEDLYSKASVLVLPSRCEGFGLPVIEAMSRGVPVIAADTTALPEVVGDAGLLVAPGDVPGFASALERVLSDPKLHSRLVQRGYERARDFTWAAAGAVLAQAIRDSIRT